tara:strand:- start:819 stop:1004 length:186 start_codon:yes stop_codon:yes gene_type:complete
MLGLVWGIVTLPFAIVGFVFKLVILAIIIAISIGVYFGGEYLGWGNVLDFLRRVVNMKEDV